MRTKERRRWRPGTMTLVIAAMAIVGTSVLLYPSVAQWTAARNQSKVLREYGAKQRDARPDAATQVELAHAYNDALTSGVDVLAGANVPKGTGTSSRTALAYDDMLRVDDDGVMARLRFPAASVDIPVYHGTDEATLLRGAGHLEGSSLPVGGIDTHSVITGHRGLAEATMFTHLDRAATGDRFTIEVFGEVLTYEVSDVRVVEPEDTDSLRAVEGEDLVTLITCTPLGINTHRILVTGSRVAPTPQADLDRAGEAPKIPGFPWWAVITGAALLGVGLFVWRSGYADARVRERRRAARDGDRHPGPDDDPGPRSGGGVGPDDLLTRDELLVGLGRVGQGADRNGVSLLFVDLAGLAADDVRASVVSRLGEAAVGGDLVALLDPGMLVAVRGDARDPDGWLAGARSALSASAVASASAAGAEWVERATVLVTTDGFHTDPATLLAEAEASARAQLASGTAPVRVDLGIARGPDGAVAPAGAGPPVRGSRRPARDRLSSLADRPASTVAAPAPGGAVGAPWAWWLDSSDEDYLAALRARRP